MTLWQLLLRPTPLLVEKADLKKMVLPLPDKPSIAVMPFQNMTGDQSQDFICVGMSESLITALSKVPQLFVIARDSILSLRGKAVTAAQVSEELGVQYVLEGSILRAGDRLWVTAQLIDAVKGHHLWAERYEREPKDLFGILDDITKKIVTALHINLTWGESARMLSKGTESIEAYLKVFEAMWYTGQTTRDGLNRARQLAEEAIVLDPKFPTAYYVTGMVHMLEALTGFSKNPAESNDLCRKMLNKAIELDESFAPARAALGYNLTMLKRYDEAISEAERAYELAPNNGQVLFFYGTVLFTAGRYEEALSPLRDALRIDPIPPHSRLRSLACALGWGLQRHLEGSVRREGDRVRISAQLIEAAIGSHVFSERYDRKFADVFALQDEITLKILIALQVKLSEGERALALAKGTRNLDAYMKIMQARAYANHFTREANTLARQAAEEALALDPNYPMAYLRLCATYLMELAYGSGEPSTGTLRKAEELAQKALRLAANLAEGHAFMGRIYHARGQHDGAVRSGEQAVALAPNSDFALAALAFTLRYCGKPQEAIGLYRKAMRLNPLPPIWYMIGLGSCYFDLARYEEAISELKKSLKDSADSLPAHLVLAAVYGAGGRSEEARAEAAEVLRIDPKFSLDRFTRTSMFKEPADAERFHAALRRAGLN